MKRFKLSFKKVEGPTKTRLGLIAGRYVPREQIGRGGAGVVLLAYDNQLERLVAVKKIYLKLGESERRAVFAMDEAKRLARLQHPNIVTVFDVIVHRREVIMVMEYIGGQTLEAQTTRMTVPDFAEVARQCLDALGAAHALGMLHMDIKGTNIMLTTLVTGQRQVKLLDFGLALMVEQSVSPVPGPEGEFRGSVYTLAPEQFERKPVSVRTDLYSLGCVFYQALSRREPFQGVSAAGVIDAHLRHDFRPLLERCPDLPPQLCGWVERLMARNAEDRPAGAMEALADLEAVLAGSSEIVPSPPPDGPVDEIPASDRDRLVAAFGNVVAVRGTVQRVWENKPETIRFLNFEKVDHDDFSVLILLKNGRPGFASEISRALIGKTVRVVGQISDFHGCPQIVVDDPSQIAEAAGE